MKFDYTPIDSAAVSCGCEVRLNEPMRLHTTFQIGGPADRFYVVAEERQLSVLLKELQGRGIPFFLLGKGSNLLVSDQGIRGAVISLSGDFKKVELAGENVVRAGAAASLASVCAFARDRALTGLEFAWGIPGSAGGAVYMNAGAYGGEMKSTVCRVRHMNVQGVVGEACGEELCFSYRKSRYTVFRDAILSADFLLKQGSPAEIASEMERLMQRRKEKQPYDMPSAGSVFKRPQNGYAAALIEECGLKGRRVGGAQISPKHAGFIVNTGDASCTDVLSLIEEVQETVFREKGIRLEREVRVIGEM